MADRDLYAELGVSRTATPDEIKKVYRKLARQLHPDRNPNDKKAEDRFKRVSYAHDVLADPKKRGLYDEFGEIGLREGFNVDAARAMKGARGAGAPGGIPGGFNFEEIFGAGRGRRSGFGGTLEDLFGGNIDDLFGRGGGVDARAAGGRGRVADQESEITVTLEQSLKGVERELSLQEGNRVRTIRARIPAGVTDGGKVRLRGQGQQVPGGEAGDLVLIVRVAEHPWLRREGDDLHLTLPVTLSEAWKGATVKVPTPDGEVGLKVPPRSQGGSKLRLKGKGAPVRGGGRGDMFVHLQIRLPDGHDHQAITEAIEKTDAHYRVDPREGLKL